MACAFCARRIEVFQAISVSVKKMAPVGHFLTHWPQEMHLNGSVSSLYWNMASSGQKPTQERHPTHFFLSITTIPVLFLLMASVGHILMQTPHWVQVTMSFSFFALSSVILRRARSVSWTLKKTLAHVFSHSWQAEHNSAFLPSIFTFIHDSFFYLSFAPF